MLDIEVIENPKSDKESNKYGLVATLQHEESSDQESGSDEVISVKAFKQRYEDNEKKRLEKLNEIDEQLIKQNEKKL
jgi:hypothetical protein